MAREGGKKKKKREMKGWVWAYRPEGKKGGREGWAENE
jgi:hypothetical protein